MDEVSERDPRIARPVLQRDFRLRTLVPNPDDLLALAPEELGFVILRVLAGQQPQLLHRHNFLLASGAVACYEHAKQQAVLEVLPEGWAWLEREGLIVPRPGQSGDWVMLSRRGRALANDRDLTAYRHAHALPRASLHPAILDAGADATFVRGDYDTAVFQAFRALEVRVRTAAGLTAEDYGVNLMRKAFKPDGGPLHLPADVPSEREALMHLMAGAIGLYKNPQSHRHVGIVDANEAVEIILFASHLLRTVDRLARNRAAVTG